MPSALKSHIHTATTIPITGQAESSVPNSSIVFVLQLLHCSSNMCNRHDMLLLLSSFLLLLVAVRSQAPWPSPSASPIASPLQSPSPSVTWSRSGSHRVVIIGASAGGAVAFVCIALFIFWMSRRRDHSYKQINTSEDPKLPSDLTTAPLGTGNGKSKTKVSVSIEKQE